MNASSYLTQLEWDSAFFGFPTGKLAGPGLTVAMLQELIGQAQRRGWRLLYWFVPPEDALSLATAHALGVTALDDKRTYSRLLPDLPPPPGPVYPVRGAATPDLIALALQSGEFSRFRTDPHFAPAVFEQLYTQWLQNALRDTSDCQVLVYRQAPDGPAIGLLTLERKGGELTIGLLAVDGQARKQGIGQALLAAAYREALAMGATALRVTTQGANQPACRFYERAGFEVTERQLVFHLWLPQQE